MKRREYFLYTKKTNITTLFNNSSNLHCCRAILKSLHWTQNAYAVLCQPHHTDAFSSFIYAWIWTQTAYARGVADTEQRTHFAFSVIYLAVNGTVTSLPVFIQNILNCVPKMNETFTGLVINDNIFILGWSNPLILLDKPRRERQLIIVCSLGWQ